MNLSFVKLFSKQRAATAQTSGARGKPVYPSKLAAAVAFAVAAFALAPAYAQSPAQLPTPDDDQSAISAADLITAPPTGKEVQDLPNVAASSQIVFQVLAAEVALQRNQAAPAYQTYLALARDTHDPRFAQRATEIAIAAQSPERRADGRPVLAAVLTEFGTRGAVERVAADPLRQARRRQGDLTTELAKVPAEQRGDAILSLQILLSRGPNRVGGLNVLKDLDKNDLDRPETQLALARQQIAADDQPGAKASLEQALKLKPDYLPAALTLARMGPKERNEGIASFEKYLEKDPKSHDARLALAQLYLSADRLDDAQKQFEIMRKNDPKDLTPLMALALDQHPEETAGQGAGLPERNTRRRLKARRTPIRGRLTSTWRSCRWKERRRSREPVARQDSAHQPAVPAGANHARADARQAGKVDEARQLLGSLQTLGSARPRVARAYGRRDAVRSAAVSGGRGGVGEGVGRVPG